MYVHGYRAISLNQRLKCLKVGGAFAIQVADHGPLSSPSPQKTRRTPSLCRYDRLALAWMYHSFPASEKCRAVNGYINPLTAVELSEEAY